MAEVRPDAVTFIDVIQVIKTVAVRGSGTEEDPFRNITQFWTLDGSLIVEFDIQKMAGEIISDYQGRSAALREMMK